MCKYVLPSRYLHVVMQFVDPAQELYQYSLRMAPWGLIHVVLQQCE